MYQLSVVTVNSVVYIFRYQPTEEDKEMYKNYKGDKSLLQQADVFLMKVTHLKCSVVSNKLLLFTHSHVQLCNIPMLSTRLDLLYTIEEFPANFEGFKPVSILI